MSLRMKLSAACLAWGMAFGCAGNARVEPQGGEDAKSSLARLTATAPAPNLAAAVQGLNDFSLTLHRNTSHASTNAVTSPISITTALAMTSAGAATTTLDAFRHALNIGLPQNDFHSAMNTLDLALGSRGQGSQGTGGRPFRLSILNQTFAQKGFRLEQNYLDVLAQHYGSGLKLLDFKEQTEDARLRINDFVSYHTDALVPELLHPGVLTTDTRVVLANAVYFNASWASPFNKTLTSPGSFIRPDGTQVQAPMLRNSAYEGRAATVDGVEVVELAYQGNEVSMLLLVPPAEGLVELESTLNAAKLESYLGALRSETLNFSMPKFEIDLETAVVPSLKEQGLAVAFDADNADFSAMTGDRSLSISDVIHHSVIKVSEEGTEAAGATAVIIGERTSAPIARTLHVDRPFVFLIRDHATGALLFMGHVVDPR